MDGALKTNQCLAISLSLCLSLSLSVSLSVSLSLSLFVSVSLSLPLSLSVSLLALLLMMNLAGDHTLLAFVKQFQKNLYLLSQLRHFVDTPKRKPFYHAHISSHLTYTSTVWDGCSDILFNKLYSFHRRAARLMISDSSLSTDTKLRYLGILPLQEKLMFNKAVLVFKEYKNLAPPYLKQLFICSNIRATSRYITLPIPKIYLFKTSF